MKRLFICMLMCLAAVLPLSFLAAADEPGESVGHLTLYRDPHTGEYLHNQGFFSCCEPESRTHTLTPALWEEPVYDTCSYCDSKDTALESFYTSWGTFEFVPCAQNPLINDRHEDRFILQTIYCKNCNFLQRKQTVRETRLVCTNETYQLVRR